MMVKDLRDELREEWLLLQKQYEDFDQRALNLKALSTPLLGAGFAASIKDEVVLYVLATVVVAFCLWMLEVMWKTFQYCFTDRIKAIERYFIRPDENSDFKPYQVYTSWVEVFDREKWNARLWLDRAFQPFVMLPYVPMIVFGLILAVAMS